MTNAVSPKTVKRARVYTALLLAIVLVGIVLFFVFGPIADPLLSQATTSTIVS